MRAALRIAIVVLAVGVLLLGALAVVLPRLAGSEAVAERIRTAAREATGQEARWTELSVGLLPPRLVVREASLRPPEEKAEPTLEAKRVGLRVALLPLFARTLVVDSLELEGIRVRLVRTAEGLELPIAPPAAPREEKPSEPEAAPPEEAPGEEAGFALALRSLRLRDSTFVLEDRAVSPAVTWELSEVNAEASGRALDEPIDVSLEGRIASGGALRASGSVQLDGHLDLTLHLEDVVVDPATPYLGAKQRLAGKLSGRVEAEGPAAAPTKLAAELELREGEVVLEDVEARGRFAVSAELKGELARPTGSFEVDATDAELAYGDAFRKPAGTQATATGRIVAEADGTLGVDEVRLKVRDFRGQGRIRLGERLRLQLDAPAFSVAGWEAMVPALAEWKPAGEVALEDLRVATAPLELAGAIRLAGLSLDPGTNGRIALDGVVRGAGGAVRAEALRVRVAEQPLELDATLSGLADVLRYRVAARASAVDIHAILAALTDLDDTLYGPLTLTSEISGPLGGASPLETAAGRARVEIGQGRLVGVSLLRSTFERLGTFGEAALVLGALRGGKTLQRFYGDEFESVSGTFDLGGGFARTQDLRLVYRHYAVDLRGALGLVDQSLDFTGTLTIEEEIDAVLAESVEGATPEPDRKVIPLARVVGTLTSPRVDLSPRAVASFASSYALARRRGKLEEEIDEELGEGAGKEILDTLEGIFGGRKR